MYWDNCGMAMTEHPWDCMICFERWSPLSISESESEGHDQQFTAEILEAVSLES